MSIEEKLKNHFGSKRDFKRDKIHATMNKVFFLLTLLLSSIITAQITEEIDDSDLPTYSKYVLDSDVNQINNFINSKGAYATRIINNGGRNFTVSYAILNTGQSFTTTYDYSQRWKPSMDEYEIDMNYLRAQKIEKAEKERKKKLEIARRAAEFKKNHPLSNLDPYEIKDKIEQIVPFIENFWVSSSQFGNMFKTADLTLFGSSEGLIEHNISILHFSEGIFILAILQFF